MRFHPATAGRLAGAFALLLALSACDDGGTAPETDDLEVTADVAAMTAEVIAADFGLFGDGMMAGGAVTEAQAVDGCSYVASTGRWECAPVTRDGRTLVRSYAFFDVQDAPQQNFSHTTTNRVNHRWLDSGVVNRSREGVTHVDSTVRRRVADVRGLAGHPDTVHRWNAVGTASHRVTRTGQIVRRSTMTAFDTTADVRVRLPRDVNPWPLSGTVIRNVTVTSTGDAGSTGTRTGTRRVVVTFNGTSTVPMTINGVAHTLDLATRRVTRN